MSDRISDDRLAHLVDGWQQQSEVAASNGADEHAETCYDTAAALRELAALRRPLAELKKEAESEEGMEPQRMMQYLCRRVDALQKTTRKLQPENERLKRELAECSETIAKWTARSVELGKQIDELRRPVGQSEQTQVSDIRLSEIRQYFSLYSFSSLQSDTVKLLDELKAIRDKSSSQHSDDMAVDRFCLAMKSKLSAKRQQGRWGWEDPQTTPLKLLEDCLRDHVGKGDPVDVANFAMMIWNRVKAGV